MNVLVTGSHGQLGKCIREIVYKNAKNTNDDVNYIFADRNMLDITDKFEVLNFINTIKPDVVVNCAAYTDVEGAEDNSELAYQVNSVGVDNLAYACYTNKSYLIHISTDFVFDGNKQDFYCEDDETNPLNVYGKSKFDGEISALCYPRTIIIRTSWLYSEYNKNFYKTMLERIKNNIPTKVINDQYGTPTNAHDLAEAIFRIIEQRKYIGKCGVYHYSNKGITTWYGFALAIEINYKTMARLNGTPMIIDECETSEYKTKAYRPKYSALDHTKFNRDFNIHINTWDESLKLFMEQVKF